MELLGVEAIIAYNPNSFFLLSLIRFCRRRELQLIVDFTEWYDSSHLPGGRIGPAALDEWLRMRIISPRISKGIVITTFLQDHFVKSGMLTALIPPTVDLEDHKWSQEESDRYFSSPSRMIPIRLIYAGSPGKKDSISEIMKAVKIINGEKRRVVLYIVGPTKEDLKRALGSVGDLIQELGDALVFTGRVPAEQVPDLIRSCHFSIIARPVARYAKAGFPTKLVESCAAGRPVITTSTGDEGKYIRDGVSGYIVDSCDSVHLSEALERASSLNVEEWTAMAQAAHEVAERIFDFRRYPEALQRFIDVR